MLDSSVFQETMSCTIPGMCGWGRKAELLQWKQPSPPNKYIYGYMHTWASHCSQTQPSTTELFGQKHHKGNSFPLWELHLTLWLACPKNRAGSAVWVSLCKHGPQGPRSSPHAPFGTGWCFRITAERFTSLPPPYLPASLCSSQHQWRLPGEPRSAHLSLRIACRAMMQGPVKAQRRPSLAWLSGLSGKHSGVPTRWTVFYWMTGHF